MYAANSSTLGVRISNSPTFRQSVKVSLATSQSGSSSGKYWSSQYPSSPVASQPYATGGPGTGFAGVSARAIGTATATAAIAPIQTVMSLFN